MLESSLASQKTALVMYGNMFEGLFISGAAIVLKYTRDSQQTMIFPLPASIFVFLIFVFYSVESPEFLY